MPQYTILIEQKRPWSVRAHVVEAESKGRAHWLARFGLKDELKPGERSMGVVEGTGIALDMTLAWTCDPRGMREDADEYEYTCHRVRRVAGKTSDYTLCGKTRTADWGSPEAHAYGDECVQCLRQEEKLYAK